MRKMKWVPAALAGFLLTVAILYAAVASFTYNAGNYPQEPPYDAMAGELSTYLAGNLPQLSDELFNEQEILHMEDVLHLFQGGRRIAAVCLWLGLALAVLGWIAGRRRGLGKGLLIGIGLFAGVAAFIAIWAAVDFNGWFVTMHELVFTNDLWLFDPAESALIRMLPLDYFIHAVQVIGLRFLLGVGILAGAGIILQLPRQRREKA